MHDVCACAVQELQTDSNVVLEAVKQNGGAILYASKVRGGIQRGEGGLVGAQWDLDWG